MSFYVTELPRAFHRRYPSTTTLSAHLNDGSRDAVTESLKNDIARALHLWPSEIDLCSVSGLADIKAGLARALRAQRRHARCSQWSYDLAAHARLLDIRRRLAALDRSVRKRRH